VLRVSSEIDGLDDDDDVDDDNVDEENLHLLKLVVSDFTSIVLECSRKVVSHYPLTLRLMVMNMNSEEGFSKPFTPVQEQKTLMRYIRVACGLVLMLFRNHMSPQNMKLPDYVSVHHNTSTGISDYLEIVNNASERKRQLLINFLTMLCYKESYNTHNYTFPAVFYVLLYCFKESSGNLESGSARRAIAGLFYIFRLVSLEYLSNEEDFPKDNDFDQSQFEEFLKLSRPHTPFAALAMTQKLCVTIAKQTSHIPNFFWDSNMGEIDNTSGRIGGQRVTLSMLRTGLGGLKKDIEREFVSILAGFTGHSVLQLRHFRENAQKTSSYYNFVLEPDNVMLRSVIQNFNNHMFPKLYPNGILDTVAAKSFLSKCNNLQKLFLVYIHMTSGQPARATELELYTIINTEHRGRTIKQMEDFNIVLHQSYGKVDQLKIADSNTLRFLDPSFGLLFNKYLALMRNIECSLIGKIQFSSNETEEDVKKRIATYSTYLWVSRGSRLDSNELGRIFQNVLLDKFQFKVTIGQYRHVHIAFMNEHLKLKIDDFSEDFDEQAGHSSETADQHYARTNFHLDQETRNSYQIKLKTSFKWMKFLEVLPNMMPDAFHPTLEYNLAVTQISSEGEYLRATAGAVQQAVSLSHCKYIIICT